MTTWLLVVLGLWGLLAVVGLFFADRLIFPAPAAGYRAGELEGFRWLTASDGKRIAAQWLRAAPSDGRAATGYTILYSHGNGEDLASIAPVLRHFQRLGFDVLAYDYRGYGASDGSPSAAGVVLDARAAYDHATGELRVAPERLLIYGRSVGGGPSVALAAELASAGLVLESTFTSAFRVVTRVPLLPGDRFLNERLLRDVDVPVLVIHGRRDEVVAFSHGQRLYEVAGEPKHSLWIDAATHNDVWVLAHREVGEALLEFVGTLEHDDPAPREERGRGAV